MGHTWENVFSLSEKGRRVVASTLGVNYKKIPTSSIDFKTRHTLIVSDIMDYIKMDGETEVRVMHNDKVLLVADAVGIIDGVDGVVYLEVDLSNNKLDKKIDAYKKVSPDILFFATHRPNVVHKITHRPSGAPYFHDVRIIDISNIPLSR